MKRRPVTPRGEDGSMAFYLVISIVGLALASLLMPMIVTSSQVTRSDTSRDHAIDAARTGLNVMLSRIRAAQDDSVGTSTKLPCNAATGRVNGDGTSDAAGVAAYRVSVAYYMNDPVTVPKPSPMRCAKGYGTYDPVSGTFTPRYAQIISVGTDVAAVQGATPGRTLTSTYTFKTTNTNIVGGQIRIFPAAGATTSYCLDAGSATPSAGAAVKLQVCDATQPPTAQQVWAYRSDLTIQLVSSATTAVPDGLCIDTADPPTKGNPVILKNCSVFGTTPPPYTQQWSFNDNGAFQASLTDSKTTGTLSSQCFAAPSQNIGIALALANCSDGGGTSSPTQAWIPSPAVGAGAAKSPQLINYEEFGRCLDITDQKVDSDHLIDYPCKQNPKPDAVAFNQKFTTPSPASGTSSATGQIYTTLGTTKYCLTSPTTTGGYVTTTVCVSGQANQTWTVYGGDSSLTYSQKYQIVDNISPGRCLSLGDPAGTDKWSSINVEPCNGSIQEKWNASPDLVNSTVSGITEPTTGGS